MAAVLTRSAARRLGAAPALLAFLVATPGQTQECPETDHALTAEVDGCGGLISVGGL